MPFVGRAGKLLDKLLEEVGLSRERGVHRERPQVAAAREPRPPAGGDRRLQALPPPPDRADRAAGDLHARKLPTKLLTRSQRGITGVHGRPQVHELGGRLLRVYPLFHPAAALRSTKTLEELRADFARLPALLEEPPPVPVGAVAPVTAAAAARPAEPAPPTLSTETGRAAGWGAGHTGEGAGARGETGPRRRTSGAAQIARRTDAFPTPPAKVRTVT